MKIKRRKMHPEPPRWLAQDVDDCWWCEKRFSHCGGCGMMRKLIRKGNDKLRQARNKRKSGYR